MFWYDDNDSLCMFDYLVDEDDVKASDACCACGGGHDRNILLPTAPPTVCVDATWFDVINNYDCDFFDPDYDCDIYGEVAINWLGMSANEACCVCGGGDRV